MSAADHQADQGPNCEAERALLGGLLTRGDGIADVCRIVDPNHFRGRAHRVIYEALQALAAKGEPLDVTLTVNALRAAGRLDDVGGHAYLVELLTGIPRGANVAHYARLVRGDARIRSIQTEATALAIAASEGDEARAREHLEALTAATENREQAKPVDIYSVESAPPEFTVDGFQVRGGLHLWWAVPSAGKTYVAMSLVHQLLARSRSENLFGHPDLRIRRGYRRVLWVGTEETTGRLRYRAERVLAGLGRPELSGECIHLWAADPRARVTLDDLPALVERYEPDAVIVDPLTGLRPKELEGRRIEWDRDNDAANQVCVALRGLAAEYGVDLVLIHHSNKGGQEYRGPVDWWASADVKIGLVPDDGRVRVSVEKMRDGRKPEPFYLDLEFTADSVRVEYAGEARADKLTPTAEKVLAYLTGVGSAPQYIIAAGINAHRQSVTKAMHQLDKAGLVRATGEKIKSSAVYERVDQVMSGVELQESTGA